MDNAHSTYCALQLVRFCSNMQILTVILSGLSILIFFVDIDIMLSVPNCMMLYE